MRTFKAALDSEAARLLAAYLGQAPGGDAAMAAIRRVAGRAAPGAVDVDARNIRVVAVNQAKGTLEGVIRYVERTPEKRVAHTKLFSLTRDPKALGGYRIDVTAVPVATTDAR